MTTNIYMSISTNRLDRFISKKCQVGRRSVRLFIAQKRILVDGQLAASAEQIVNKFSHIVFDGHQLQNNKASYLMLHKPVGVVCATKDEIHQTVLDLVDHPDKESLHIVGRLDLNTSGLVLLTNDSRWSEKLTSPENKVNKHYRVTLKNKLSDEYIDAFAQGMYFSYEDIITAPAKLEIISDHVADVWLTEGRYHQIKRMFGRFRNPVAALHRIAIGKLVLDESLPVGSSRDLSDDEKAC